MGCSSKEDYILFNQAKIHNTTKNTNNNQTKQTRRTSITEVDNIQFEYKIQPHDRISLIVYKHPDLSTTTLNSAQKERGLLVNSKGDIRVPLIKKIHIAGLTQTQAENLLSDSFSVYLKSPDIQLEVLNKRAYIIGEVKRPGKIELLNEELNLLQVIAIAGDLTETANKKSILILKGKEGGQVQSQIVDLTDIHSISTANLMIHPNDIVYVMPTDMKMFNNSVKSISPIFNLVGSILKPFVDIKFLTR